MSDNKHIDGVDGLKKYDLKVYHVVFMLFCMCAAGAYGIEEMVPLSGPGMTITMLIIGGIFWAIPVGLCVAEMAALLPLEGGIYAWAKEAFGEMWGFLACWWETLMIFTANATYVVLICGYMENLLNMTPIQIFLVKMILILAICVVNLLGIKEVGRLATILSIIVLSMFVLITVTGFTNWNYNPMQPFTAHGNDVLHCLGGSICIMLWMYSGYESISTMAGEIKNPQIIPKGLMIVIPIIVLTYVLPITASVASVGNWELWSTEGGGENVGYVDVLIDNIGPIFGWIFIVVAMVSQLSMFNTYMASGSRGFFVLSDQNLCPKFLTKVSKKRGVPYVGILLLTAVTIVMSVFDFTTILMLIMPLGGTVYLIMLVTVRKLRKLYPIEERRKKKIFFIPGGKILFYIICTVPMIFPVLSFYVNGTEYLMLGFISIASGPLVYILFKKMYGGLSDAEPEKYPLNEKTKLNEGDITRIGKIVVGLSLFALVGSIFMVWYEGPYGAEYYREMYGNGIIGNFNLMISILRYGGIGGLIAGILIFGFGKKHDPIVEH